MKTNSRFLFTSCSYHEFPDTEKIYIRCQNIANGNLPEALKDHYIWGGYTSPVGAISLAVLLGFKTIGVIGVDLYGSHAFGDAGTHVLTKEVNVKKTTDVFDKIRIYLNTVGISIANLSAESKVETIPYVDMDTFLTWT